MGASLIERIVKGKNIEEAWRKLQEDSDHYSGHHEGYSGDFNSCTFQHDLTHMLKTNSFKTLDIYIIDQLYKREAYGYCMQPPINNTNKVKSTVSVNPQRGTRKWETIYKAVTTYEGREVARDKSQTDCIKKARAHVEKYPDESLRIIIAKELTEGHVVCASVTYKESKGEKQGLYKFIGLAPD